MTILLSRNPDLTLSVEIFGALQALYDTFIAINDILPKELAEKKEATRQKNHLRREIGEKMMRCVFNRAKSFWGDDDACLLELGFVPKSMIWTPGKQLQPLTRNLIGR